MVSNFSLVGQMYGTYNGEISITDELERTFLYTFKASARDMPAEAGGAAGY